MKVLCNCGRSGNAEKIMVQDNDKKKTLYVCYCYLGNPSQDFVIDEKGNLVHGKKEAVVKIAARDYIFHTKY